MELNWFQSIVLGIISGFAEVLPVSAQAHRLVLLKMFGINADPAALRLMIHIGTAVALYLYSKRHIVRMLRARRLVKIPKNRRKRPLDIVALQDLSLLKMTMVPIVLSLLFCTELSFLKRNLLYVAGLLLINGIILYIPQYLPGSNKESGAMTRIDSMFFGLGAALGIFPGISGIGTAISIGSVRGMDLKKALDLALIMHIPVHIGFALFDLIELVQGGAGSLSFRALIAGVLAGICAFAAVALAIRFLKKFAENAGYSIFGFYSWGAALLTFIFYLAAA